jgi:hypothetical protein
MESGKNIVGKLLGENQEFLIGNDLTILGRGDEIILKRDIHGNKDL